MTIGPKPEPRPLILHVDDSGNPKRLAESDIIYVTTINAENYENLPFEITAVPNVTGISVTSLQGTGIFLTTGEAAATYLTQSNANSTYATQTSLNSYLLTGTAAATYATQTSLNSYLLTGTAATLYATNAELETYLGPISDATGVGKIPYYDTAWELLDPGSNGQVLTLISGKPQWDNPCGTVSIPVQFSQGGTGTTTAPTANRIPYSDGSKFVYDSNFTYNASLGRLAVCDVTLTAPLAISYGGTNATTNTQARSNLGLGDLATVNSPLPVTQGGTGTTTSPTSYGVMYFDSATTSIKNSSNFTFNGTKITANDIGLANALTVGNGGTGRTTLTAGNFLVGNGTSPVTFQLTSNYLLTGTAAATYFNKLTDTLSIAQGGTGTGTQTANGILWYDSVNTRLGTNTTLKLGTASKLLAVCGVAIPTKGLYLDTGDGSLNPTTSFKLQDLGDVTATAPTTGQILRYGTSEWAPVSLGSINVTSFAGTGVFDTTANTNSTYISKPITPGTNTVLYYNGTSWAASPTGSNGEYLRINGGTLDWETPAGAAETWTTIFKTSDETRDDDNPLIADSDLTFQADVTGSKNVKFCIFFSADAADGFKYTVTHPAINNFNWNILYTSPATGFVNSTSRPGTGTFPTINAVTDTTGHGYLEIQGVLNLSTTGTVSFDYCKEDIGSGGINLRIFAGSYVSHTY